MHDDFEPVRGLPEALPEGERILWQGAPEWRALARRAFHTHKVATYFAILTLWEAASAWQAGLGALASATAGLWMVGLGAGAVSVLALLAFVFARTTVYTITNKRIVLRYGVALPMAINLPFKVIDSAAFRQHGAGDGDVPVALTGGERIGYYILWPNVRPWRFARPEPMLRALPDPEDAASALARALADYNGQSAPAREIAARTETPSGAPAEAAA